MEEHILRMIGQLLAQGLAHDEVVEKLCSEPTITPALTPIQALQYLRQVYDSWQELQVTLKLQIDDAKNWHVFLRHQLLQKALSEKNIHGFRLALAVLDSLADLQGLTQKQLGMVEGVAPPITINFIDKPLT